MPEKMTKILSACGLPESKQTTVKVAGNQAIFTVLKKPGTRQIRK